MSFYQKETKQQPPKNKKIHSSESFFSVWTIIWESQQTFDKIESLLIICIFFTTPEWVFGRRWLSCQPLWLSLSTWDKVTANNSVTEPNLNYLCHFPVLYSWACSEAVFQRFQSCKWETCPVLPCTSTDPLTSSLLTPCSLSHPDMKGELWSHHPKNLPIGRKSLFSHEDQSETSTLWGVPAARCGTLQEPALGQTQISCNP